MQKTAISKQKQRSGDFTCGSIPKKLLLFSLPILGANLLQQLYNTVDILIVANFSVHPHAMSAVGACGFIVSLMVGFFTGFAVGTGVVISQHLGAKRWDKVSHTVHTAVILSLIGGVFLAAVGICSARWLLLLLQTPPELISEAETYLRIYFCGLPALLLYNMGTAIFGANGDSRRPLFFLAIGGILNVTLDILFIAVFQWGVVGVALATLITEILPAALILFSLMRTDSPCKICLKKLRIHKSSLRPILKIGLPAGMQSTMITIPNMVSQSFINSYGADAVAGFTAYCKVEMLLWLPLIALSQAVTTFISQNYGAGQLDRIQKGLRFTLAVAVCVTLFTSGMILLFSHQIFGIFLHTPATLQRGLELIPFTVPMYFLYAFLEILPGAIRGLGQSTVPMVILIVNRCGVLIGLIFFFTSVWDSLSAVTAGYPITWFVTLTCLLVCYYFCYRNRKRLLQNQSAL